LIEGSPLKNDGERDGGELPLTKAAGDFVLLVPVAGDIV
jgi:hypothetical protein